MLTFIDISGWQSDLDPSSVYPNIDAVMIKATEGTGFVSSSCDPFVQAAIKMNKPWGFYHYARSNNATAEADYFISNCENYFGNGIPVLDWEEGQSVAWVNEFVRRIHEKTGVWPWIYSNASNFNQGGVEQNCGRWVAVWPFGAHPSFSGAMNRNAPTCDGLVCAWQFCADGRVDGYSGDLDCDVFYGSEVAWRSYAKGSEWEPGSETEDSDVEDSSNDGDSITLEGEGIRVTVERVS